MARVISKTQDASGLRVLNGDRTAEITQANGYVDPKRTDGKDSTAIRGTRYCIMKILNTSLEPIPVGKNIALGLATEYRSDVACEESVRRRQSGSHEPRDAVKVVGSNPPTMAIVNENMVKGEPRKPIVNENMVKSEPKTHC